MSPKTIIYPIFLPHLGCPHLCIYCNQHAVTSTAGNIPDPIREARHRMEAYARDVRANGKRGELAFYGSTFTALPVPILRWIMNMAQPLVQAGLFSGIRFSTRPDALEEEVLTVLSEYPVTTVEIGVQSLSDIVLTATGRGYLVEDVLRTAERVKRQGWRLGLQLMVGLPEDTRTRFLGSVRSCIQVQPDFMRIYPTLVFAGTQLADWFSTGRYRPLSLDEAIDWVVPAYEYLSSAGIPVIRMGLHADPALEKPDVILAGPHHPAFGYLVRCRWWRDRVHAGYTASPGISSGEALVRVPPARISEAIGPERSNPEYWKSEWKLQNVRVLGDSSLAGTEFTVQTS